MKYFFDTEFHEGFYKPLFGRKRHSVDFISIGMVAEDGREYYAIANDFDIDAAWNSYDIKKDFGKPQDFGDKKVYWLRDNVLQPMIKDIILSTNGERRNWALDLVEGQSDLNALKNLLRHFGKPKKQIADELITFTHYPDRLVMPQPKPEFYAYYAGYDWVAFCTLYGRMIDLPKGMPMYCRDLKQMLDEGVNKISEISIQNFLIDKKGYTSQGLSKANIDDWSFDLKLEMVKAQSNYPKQDNEHNALDDAKWNKKLYDFITV